MKKSEMMLEMQAKRKEAGLRVLSLYVTAENKDKFLKNIGCCSHCQSAFFITDRKMCCDSCK